MGRRRNLTILSIEGDRQSEKASNVIPINFQSYHIIEIFMNYFPKLELDGSSKLVIYFKEKPDNEEQYMKNDFFGVSWYYVDKEEISKLEMTKKEELGEYYLEIIVEVLKAIACKNGREKVLFDIIDETATRVRESKYELFQRVKTLSKTSDDKKVKANVYRHVSSLGEMWYVEFEDEDKNISRYELMKKYSFVSKIDVFKKARWEKNTFILVDKFDKVIAKVSLDE